MSTFGFIGTGNMGGALARAAAKSLPGENILLSNRTAEKAAALIDALQEDGFRFAPLDATVKPFRFY